MRNPKEIYRGDRPYVNNREYLSGQIEVFDCLLYTLFDKKDAPEGEKYRKQLEERIHGQGWKGEVDLSSAQEQNESRIMISMEAGVILPLEWIVSFFQDKTFFRHVFLAILLFQMDSWYQKCINAFLNRSEQGLTLKDCIQLFYPEEDNGISGYGRISDDIWLLPYFLPESKAEDLMTRVLPCDARLIDLILGKEAYCPAGVSFYRPREKGPMLFSREAELERMENLDRMQEVPPVILCGDAGAGKKTLLCHVADIYREKIVFCDLKQIGGEGIDKEHFLTGIYYAVREAVFNGSWLAFTNLDELEAGQQKELLNVCRQKLGDCISKIYLTWNGEEYKVGREEIYVVKLHVLTEEERLRVWIYFEKELNQKGELSEEISLRNVANTFVMTPGQIYQALKLAQLNRAGGTKSITEAELYRSCYAQLEHKLAEKTTKVQTVFTLDMLKMEARDKRVLRDVCNCICYRNVVMEQWKFRKVVPYGAGITVLFAGPPGTGKTMAAQVIANELHMELYKIDLSQIIDKYVGETEKNIRQIFEQAKKSNSILFFDEADSIFNKRLEASNANERFANIESSLLLQCIEEYNGIAILATNNYTAMDPAFIRRFKYYLLFREPDKKIRYEIWAEVFPEETPVSAEVDYQLLAELFELTGAVIKNVALAAAYLAAARESEITIIDILVSIKREMQKNNLILTREKLGSLGYLYDELL